MNSERRDESRLAADLANYDEALRQGEDPESPAPDTVDPADTPALNDLQECLIRLEHRFPRRETAETSTPDEFVMENRVGRFRIERELGRGGFGVVFRAHDPELDRHVALKIPRFDTLDVPEMRQRFLHEAKAAAGLDHPNIVPVHEVGQIGPVCYITLAYCEGPDLATWLAEQDGPIPIPLAAQIVAALAEAVEHGHQQGILHRDLKPQNVMLVPVSRGAETSGGLPVTPCLTDFGMAKLVDAGLTQTRSSVLLGTPAYMSPEQAEGHSDRLGPATDIYSLGAILYELLTGRPPYDEDSVVKLLDRLRFERPTRCARTVRPSIPVELETIVLKCLRYEPAARYTTAAELAADLRRFLHGKPIAARKLSFSARLWSWAKRSQRIREAGVLMICLNSIVVGWVSLNLMLHMLGIFVPVNTTSAVFTRDTLTVIAIHGFAVALGVRMLWGTRLAIWLGMVVSLGLFLNAVAMAVGWGKPFGGTYQDPIMRMVVFNVLSMMFALQLAACATAAIAQRTKRW